MPDPHGDVDGEIHVPAGAEPLDHALGVILEHAQRILTEHGIGQHRVAVLVDDLTRPGTQEDTVQGGMVFGLPAAEAMTDVLAFLFAHLIAFAKGADIPIAQVAANCLWGSEIHTAYAPEDVADVIDSLRAMCAGAAHALEPPRDAPEGAELAYRDQMATLLGVLAAVTLTQAVMALLHAAGVHDGADGAPRPEGWPEHLPWGTD